MEKIEDISIWGFYDYLSGSNSDYLQKLENILLWHYKPLFGRQRKSKQGFNYV